MNQGNNDRIVMSPSRGQDRPQYTGEDFGPGNTPVVHRGVRRMGGGFAEDLPIRDRRDDVHVPARETRPERPPLDTNKLFFIQQGKDKGGMRMNWRKWRYVLDASGRVEAVDVIYEEQRDEQDFVISVDKVTLYGADAFNFLKVVQDRNAESFADERSTRRRQSNNSFQA